MKTAHPSARAGFTLIELLMVILIIGLLSGLLLVAVNAGVNKAREAAVATEIEQLSMGVESFKSDKGAYPVSAGWTFKENFTSNSYQQRIMRSVSKVFSRYASDYATFRTNVFSGTLHVTSINGVSHSGGLDVNNLDQAESLVFWLGGLPDLDSETKLIGFRNDPLQPFVYPIVAAIPSNPTEDELKSAANVTARNKNRQQPRYAFDPKRLVDYDNDGWWEYIPNLKPTVASAMAPYVYFDSPSFDFYPFYPVPSGLDGAMPIADAVNALTWGQLIPYASESNVKFADSEIAKIFNGTTAYRPAWMNSKKFQIIAAGRDGCYGRTINTDLYATDPIFPTGFGETRLLPSCVRLSTVSSSDHLLPETEFDNQTNFTTGKLGDEIP